MIDGHILQRRLWQRRGATGIGGNPDAATLSPALAKARSAKSYITGSSTANF